MVGYGEEVKGYRIFFPEINTVHVKKVIVFLEQGKKNT